MRRLLRHSFSSLLATRQIARRKWAAWRAGPRSPMLFPMNLLFLLALGFPLLSSAEPCREIRAALDIGSGSAKALAAVVDTCKKQIVETAFEQDTPFACNEAMEKAGNGKIPLSFLDEAAPRVLKLVTSVKEKGATNVVINATSCLRRAANGKELAADLAKRLGVPVRVITQEEEADLGFLSAMAAHRIPADEQVNVVVWDTGGGSMQMEAVTVGERQAYKGTLAAVSFKNQIITEIQKKKAGEVSSPNPLGEAWPEAVKLAEAHARKNVPAFFRNIKGQRRWLGIGGALALSVQEQVNPQAHYFTREEVKLALSKRAKLNDEEIGGDYRLTQVSNLALILGFMQALGIERVETARASLNQGVLTQEAFRPARAAVPLTQAPGLPLKAAPKPAGGLPNTAPAHP
ncbi:MAG: hypothetical protein EOP11_02020 [Proteobacteria bacterium]|nr:MAG: hypothetical protein EOP11_02020 [Pseudomonadota bacterium]